MELALNGIRVANGRDRVERPDVPEAAREAVLVDRCRRNDLEAFGEIVDLYQARVHGYVRRMLGGTDEADDVTQDVFVKAYRNIGRFDGRASLRTWLFRIAHNLCIDRARRRGRQVQETVLAGEDEPGYDEMSDTRWQPEDVVMNAELIQTVETAIAGLSEKLRAVILLHDREEMAYDEIAAMLEIPVGTVKSRLFLARGHLQRAVGDYLEGAR